MCGFTGYWDRANVTPPDALAAMTSSLFHRGPDDDGHWHDKERGIALGFRRLSILDLTAAGHQPMVSSGGRYEIVFNGEIYNHLEIRRDLESCGKAPAWRGHSDTETLLASFETWGIEATLKKTVGMFAIALWDCETCSLMLARDRMGEKPLYYGWQGNVFLFGSELKSLRAHPAFRAGIDRGALCSLLRYNYIPAPWSIYDGIRKLEPGTWLTIKEGEREPRIEKYWSVEQVVKAGIGNRFTGDDNEAITVLASTLNEAIRGQMVADVPLGALLSGGIDSSTVVALMQAQSTRPVRTFTIGFREQRHNEAEFAKQVARHLGTDHTELYLEPGQALDVIPRLPRLYDEPFADSSQIPTFLVAQLARRHVTVSLSGDGGDELFCGYNRYFVNQKRWSRVFSFPAAARRLMARTLTALSPAQWDCAYAGIRNFLPETSRIALVGDKAYKLAEKIRVVGGMDQLYYALVSEWWNPEEVVREGVEHSVAANSSAADVGLQTIEERMMYLDSISYLPDDILAKVDRAAMGASLETRTPFLDHRVVELAWRLPLDKKLRGGKGKWILRKVLDRHVPRSLIERPKQGFGIPLDAWLRGPLRDWAESLLDPGRLRRQGYFHPELIRQKWAEHLSGSRNWQYRLWSVLMFQAWLESAQ